MKSFIKKILIFGLTTLAVLFLLLFVLSVINKRALNNYKVPADATTLFIGDSHIQLGIVDKQIPHSVNIAKPGEVAYYTVYKLDPILKNNPQIKKVYLGYSYHSFSSYTEDNIYGSRSKDIAARYFFILPLSEQMKMIGHNSKVLSTFFRNSLTNGMRTLRTKNKDFSFIGGYENYFYNASAIDTVMDKRINTQYLDNNTVRGFSSINIVALGKIIALCKKANVELVILNMPIHDYYKSRIPQKFIEKYNDLVLKNGLKEIAFEKMVLTDDYFIADGDHLSIKGAMATTEYLMKNDSTLSPPVKQLQ